MKTLPSLTPSLRYLFLSVGLLALSLARAQTTPATSPPPRGFPAIPQNPWFDGQPIPTDDELKVLKAARETAERNIDVRITNRIYAERFGAADDLVRTLMFNNPAIKDPLYSDQDTYLMSFKYGQVLHERNWSVGQENSPDFLLPDPLGADWLSMSMGSSPNPNPGPTRPRPTLEEVLLHTPPQHEQAVRVSYGLNAIHQAALDDKDAKVALQKVRDAFQALDVAVRAAMAKDPDVKALIEKYPYLLYGRRDLGIGIISTIMMG